MKHTIPDPKTLTKFHIGMKDESTLKGLVDGDTVAITGSWYRGYFESRARGMEC